jgi:CheY-like chemotaxis protein
VLVVDENPMVRRLICERFSRELDFNTCGEAGDGHDAIMKAQDLKPDLIVTDLSMPIMDGLEETRRLKKMMPSVPIIVYSAHMDVFVEKEALGGGALAVVGKTDTVAVLIPTSQSLLRRLAA